MRLLRKMIGHPTGTTRPVIAAPPPVPADVAPEERRELEDAKRRVRPKWETFDALIEDFRAGDASLRITRR